MLVYQRVMGLIVFSWDLFHGDFMVIQYDSMGMSDWIVHGDFHGEIILSHPLRLTMLEIGAVWYDLWWRDSWDMTGLVNVWLGIFVNHITWKRICWRLYPQYLGDVKHWDIYQPLYNEIFLINHLAEYTLEMFCDWWLNHQRYNQFPLQQVLRADHHW